MLWLRLASSWIGAAFVVALVHPPEPSSGTWSPTAAVLVGTIVGAAFASLLVGLRPPISPAAAATLALTAGAEEIVWRWFALGSLAAVAGALPALAATALAFGAVHPGARLQHLATGLTFGAVYLGGGGLAGAWWAHFAYNLVVAAAARRAPPEPA